MEIFKKPRKAILAWAFIDWGNSSFSLTIMTVFFPLFFGNYWCHAPGMTPEKGTQYLAFANSGYAILIAILAPILGSVADQGKRKKRFLFFFTLLGAFSAFLLPWVAEGHYTMAIILFSVAAFGYSGNNIFNDALLTDVTESSEYGRTSSFGFALGYFGSEMLFLVNTAMVMKPAWFGLNGVNAAFKLSFVLTAIWWLTFTIPAMLWVTERHGPGDETAEKKHAYSRGFQQLWETFLELKKYKVAFTFLLAYIFYIDGINTIITMAVDYGSKIGVSQTTLILAIHVTQWVAIPATLVYGRLGEKLGAKNAIYFGILIYSGICFWARFMTSGTEFVILAGLVGGVQGGIQALSRSYFAHLIPAEKSGEFFGFYNMMGKFAAVLGPLLMGLTVTHVGERNSILSLLVLFLIGAVLLTRVREKDLPLVGNAQ